MADLFSCSLSTDIVEKNPQMFKLDSNEIENRKHFIEETKNEIKAIRDDIAEHKRGNKDTVKVVTALLNSNLNFGNSGAGATKYSRLESDFYNNRVYNETVVKIDENQSLNDTRLIKNDAAGNASTADEQAVYVLNFNSHSKLANYIDAFFSLFSSLFTSFHFTFAECWMNLDQILTIIEQTRR